MKYRTIIDETHEEEVIIYAHKRTELVESIESLVSESTAELLGYDGSNAVILNLSEIIYFTVEDNKVYAVSEKGKYRLKQRLYVVEEIVDRNFVKINQSCIANIRKIVRFDSSFSGSLSVIFKNGYRDYVSRRQLKKVKERIGL